MGTGPVIEERSLTVEEAGEIALFAKDARKVAGIGVFTLAPLEVTEAVDSYVAKTQQGIIDGTRILSGEDAMFLALQIGCLYGQQLIREFGWAWVCLIDGESENYAVVNRDRSLAWFPTYFLRGCFDNPERDCTLLLAFNMVASTRFGDAGPGTYHDVLNNVVRIVPRN